MIYPYVYAKTAESDGETKIAIVFSYIVVLLLYVDIKILNKILVLYLFYTVLLCGSKKDKRDG